MTYPRSHYAGRRALAAGPRVLDGPVAKRRAWLPVTEAALRCAGDPDTPATALAGALKGLTADTFPLGLGDARRGAVKAFIELASFWCVVSASTRTPFAAALRGLAEPLDWMLHELGAELSQQGLARRGMGEDD